jgi:hypothetical protein
MAVQRASLMSSVSCPRPRPCMAGTAQAGARARHGERRPRSRRRGDPVLLVPGRSGTRRVGAQQRFWLVVGGPDRGDGGRALSSPRRDRGLERRAPLIKLRDYRRVRAESTTAPGASRPSRSSAPASSPDRRSTRSPFRGHQGRPFERGWQTGRLTMMGVTIRSQTERLTARSPFGRRRACPALLPAVQP